jgi:hypothetical protein
MLTRVKAEGNSISIEIPADWDGKELQVEVHPVVAEPREPLSIALDRALGGKRIKLSDWKFNREELYDRKVLH